MADPTGVGDGCLVKRAVALPVWLNPARLRRHPRLAGLFPFRTSRWPLAEPNPPSPGKDRSHRLRCTRGCHDEYRR